jgi:hypothetical protein
MLLVLLSRANSSVTYRFIAAAVLYANFQMRADLCTLVLQCTATAAVHCDATQTECE